MSGLYKVGTLPPPALSTHHYTNSTHLYTTSTPHHTPPHTTTPPPHPTTTPPHASTPHYTTSTHHYTNSTHLYTTSTPHHTPPHTTTPPPPPNTLCPPRCHSPVYKYPPSTTFKPSTPPARRPTITQLAAHVRHQLVGRSVVRGPLPGGFAMAKKKS